MKLPILPGCPFTESNDTGINTVKVIKNPILMSSQTFIIPPELIKSLQASQRVAVLTGAGISAESGVPTFREAQTGLWSRYDPSQLATPEAFHRDPQLVWEWYTWRRQLISQAQPNPGHFALVELETYFSQFSLITQNVDGLHRLA